MNRSPDKDYGTFSGAISQVLELWQLRISTAIPGVVDSYDASTRRASVFPAARRLLTDGTTRDMPPIPNVPVLHPGGAGLFVHFHLEPGDPVLLVAAQRGIDGFRTEKGVYTPNVDRIHDLQDAIAIPGFGSRSAFAVRDGFTIQTPDGTTVVQVQPNEIRLEAADVVIQGRLAVNGDVTIQGNVQITGSRLQHNGVNVGSTHVHGGVDTGSGQTQGPE